MKIIKNTLIAASLVTGAQAASVIVMTADQANSDTGAFNAELVSNTLSDTSTYDPDNPTAAIDSTATTVTAVATEFEQSFGETTHWHGNKTTGVHTLSYTLTAGTFTTSTANPTIALDFYGRSNTGLYDRDNDYTVTLFNGDYTTQVAQIAGQGAADTGADASYNRTTFNLGDGVSFDRIQITSSTVPGTSQFFSVAEVRLVSVEAVPEPSSTALLGLGGLALILRRRK